MALQDAFQSANRSPERPSKRGPTTPLAPPRDSNVIRRKISGKNDQKLLLSALFSHDASNAVLVADLVDAKYRIWLLSQSAARQNEIIQFLELERELASS